MSMFELLIPVTSPALPKGHCCISRGGKKIIWPFSKDCLNLVSLFNLQAQLMIANIAHRATPL